MGGDGTVSQGHFWEPLVVRFRPGGSQTALPKATGSEFGSHPWVAAFQNLLRNRTSMEWGRVSFESLFVD